MSTKKCSKCGWIYPLEWPGKSCRFCREPFKDGICSRCKQYAPKLHACMCVACNTKVHKEWRMAKRATVSDTFDNWITKIKSLINKGTLTEAQWMEACTYFNGCAYCGKEEIQARSMFIPFDLGGKYCAWNIIPSCEVCETSRKASPNPFLRMNRQLNRSEASSSRKFNLTEERLQKIVDYLESKMEETNE